MSEALDCSACNSMMDWYGDVPDNEYDILCHACEIDRAEETIKRLSEALDRIADGDGCYTSGYGSGCDYKCKDIARAALK